jgi:ketosteroid isomerase-like protein
MNHDQAIEVLREVTAAFDRHDLEAILGHFADDAVFESPRGPEPWGQRFVGLAQIRTAFAGRFAGIPDVRYQGDDHFVDGDRGASEWTLSGTTVEARASRSWLRPVELPTAGSSGRIVLEDPADRLIDPATQAGGRPGLADRPIRGARPGLAPAARPDLAIGHDGMPGQRSSITSGRSALLVERRPDARHDAGAPVRVTLLSSQQSTVAPGRLTPRT